MARVGILCPLAESRDVVEIVLYFRRWLAGLLVLVAILLGLSYKWNWAADVLAGAVGALLGVLSGWLLGFLLLVVMGLAGFSEWLASRAVESGRAFTTAFVVSVVVPNAAALGGGVVGGMLGVGLWRLRRRRLGRNTNATRLAAGST